MVSCKFASRGTDSLRSVRKVWSLSQNCMPRRRAGSNGVLLVTLGVLSHSNERKWRPHLIRSVNHQFVDQRGNLQGGTFFLQLRRDSASRRQQCHQSGFARCSLFGTWKRSSVVHTFNQSDISGLQMSERKFEKAVWFILVKTLTGEF